MKYSTAHADAAALRAKTLGTMFLDYAREHRWQLLKHSAAALAVFLFAFAAQRTVALLGLDLHHDTMMFDSAVRKINGEVPYKDFFYQYNLATPVLHAVALSTLGMKIASLKLITVLFFALNAALIYACIALVAPIYIAIGASILWTMLSPFYMPEMNGYHAWPTIYMMTGILGGALMLSLAVNSRPFLYAFGAGVLFCLAFWFKQIAAIQILATLAWMLLVMVLVRQNAVALRKMQSIFLGYAAGGIAGAAPFFIYLLRNGAFLDWINQSIHYNSLFATQVSRNIVGFILTFLPVSRSFGYLSTVWAVLPLAVPLVILLALLGLAGRFGKQMSCSTSLHGKVALLFAALSIAGWIEYFPLPHPFHSHMFMAPIFVFVGLWINALIADGPPDFLKRWLVRGMAAALVLLTTYEALRQAIGLQRKLAVPTATIIDDSSVDHLRFSSKEINSFRRFYSAMHEANKRAPSEHMIPMSIDPLRALLPNNMKTSALPFKMGMDWTWASEVIEPGFNERQAAAIARRTAPIYTDAVLHIPGYIPSAVLRMKSPFSSVHALYIPSADASPRPPETKLISSKLLADPNTLVGGAFRLWPPSLEFAFLDFDPGDAPLSDIRDLHVSALQPIDVPAAIAISDREGFLRKTGEAGQRVAKLYASQRAGSFWLSLPLRSEDFQTLAKFMLTRGKIFAPHTLPRTATTLDESSEKYPFIAASNSTGTAWIEWAKQRGTQRSRAQAGEKPIHYLAIPATMIEEDAEVVFYVQLVYRDGRSRDFFLHYLFDKDRSPDVQK